MRSFATLLYPGFELLDVFGPTQMFGMLTSLYDSSLVAGGGGPVQSAEGLSGQADFSLEERSDFDLLLVPGGMGAWREVENTVLTDWLKETGDQAE